MAALAAVKKSDEGRPGLGPKSRTCAKHLEDGTRLRTLSHSRAYTQSAPSRPIMGPAAKPAVSFLGPVASYSHQAVRQVFSEEKWELRPATTIDDVFDEVQGGQAAAGVVPFENSTNGSVVFTLDNLADREGRYKDITVDGEVFVNVNHCLLGRRDLNGKPDETNEGSGTCTPTLTDPSPSKPRSKPLGSLRHLQRLYSHPQAFGQCNAFISTYLKGVDIFEVSSTSKAAEIVSQDRTGTWAAISNSLASSLHGLDMLGKNIEDREDNTTRFLIISTTTSDGPRNRELRGPPTTKSGSKSMVSFTVPHTCPGALADALSCFREYNLNLTSINSRPSLIAPFQYIFFVEFEGHRRNDPDGRVKGALEKIGQVAHGSRWLGSWETHR
ncbi:Prephenate dehydratase [Moelleriella libera RCEF 2490]|uniref:prephenate dehydratase n=1 Tax=Moelleriella libera RCEF 2490 TaxID=1081109 RepID=A0A162K2T4_9HYPO|nr:Prephenate dehydratase [Moelleriella libera RCEF 2490]